MPALIDDQTDLDGALVPPRHMPASGRSHRLRRAVSVLVVAIAVPAAFSASPAAASMAEVCYETITTHYPNGTVQTVTRPVACPGGPRAAEAEEAFQG